MVDPLLSVLKWYCFYNNFFECPNFKIFTVHHPEKWHVYSSICKDRQVDWPLCILQSLCCIWIFEERNELCAFSRSWWNCPFLGFSSAFCGLCTKLSCLAFWMFLWAVLNVLHRGYLIFSSPEPKAHWWAYRTGRPPSSVCLSVVCLSSTLFKHLLLRNHWADWSQISYGVSMGWGN